MYERSNGLDDVADIHRKIEQEEEASGEKKTKGSRKPFSGDLTVSSADDDSEEQADTIAQKVVSGGKVSGESFNASTSSLNASGREGAMEVPSGFSSKLNAASGGGNPLADDTREQMESSLGSDLSDVRVHTGSAADDLSDSINAKAFAHGQDIYFKEGQYNPGSAKGKELLAHELVHTQQPVRENLVQRFTPRDAAEEMIGKKFTVDQQMSWTYGADGKVTFPVGQTITVKTWENDSTTIKGEAYHAEKKKKFFVYPDKSWLTTLGDQTTGLYQYSAGVTDKKEEIQTGEDKIATLKATYQDYVLYGTTDIYDRELARLEGLQTNRYTSLNDQLIQETMFNSMDASIKKWTDHYNKTIGVPQKWTALDANLVKAMTWKESAMGTRGDFLSLPPYSAGQRMTRFNVMQAVDSSGPQQIMMMDEMDTSTPSLEDRFHYRQVSNDLFAAQASYNRKVKTTDDELKADVLKARCYKPWLPEGKRWRYNDYYTSDPRWYGAVTAFFQQTSPGRNLSYDFWIRTGVRWLFEKRKGVTSWDEAISAYNGEAGTTYRNKIKNVTSAAKTASEDGTEYIPQ